MRDSNVLLLISDTYIQNYGGALILYCLRNIPLYPTYYNTQRALQFIASPVSLYIRIQMILMTESYIREMSGRNKKFLIWNFMNELCDKYKEARSKHVPTVFKTQDFKSFNLPIFSQDKSFIFETLKEYERAKGFIKINDDNVAPTTKGLLRLMLAQHDWD